MFEIDQFYRLLDKVRVRRNLLAHGLNMDINRLRPLLLEQESGSIKAAARLINTTPRLVTEYDTYSSPRVLVEFVAKLSEHLKPSSILDPTCGSGALVAAAAQSSNASIVHAIEKDSHTAALASALLKGLGKVTHADCLSPSIEFEDSYDLVVSDPPLAAQINDLQAEHLGVTSGSRQFPNRIALWAAQKLTETGTALIVVGPHFFSARARSRARWQAALAQQGCRIRAAIRIPSGSWAHTRMSAYLLVIDRGAQEEILVGELNEDSRRQDTLISNLKRSKPKGPIEQGRLCSLESFNGFPSFVAKDSLLRQVRSTPWQGHPACCLFPRMEVAGKEEDHLSEDVHSLYLNLLSDNLASTEESDYRSPRKVLHLKVNPHIADRHFLVHWFNDTPIGQITLASLKAEGEISRIDLDGLRNAKFFLPPLEDQKEMVKGAEHLGRVTAEIAELKERLWAGSESTEDVLEGIQWINNRDTYDAWIESLPFPLASILWREHASQGTFSDRYKTLLHFFEATAQFLATIHLSAFTASRQEWENLEPQLKEKLAAQNLSLERASFGTWRVIFEYLSTKFSDSMSDPDFEEQALLRTSDRNVVAMLCDSRLRGILQEANRVRNSDLAHGGVCGEEKAKEIHGELKSLVHELRGVFGRKWGRYFLIKAGSMDYRDGRYFVSSERLMGTRSAPFEEHVYESKDPLDKGSLFLFDSVSRQSLKLLGLIEIVPSPEKRAVGCFFYNRREGDGSRFVSYHLEQEGEKISINTPALEKALQLLDPTPLASE